ncbi:hypothetical protein [Sporosalibacterium faouarense]|nr:hypothetical protein [Sporosalibacterium faouarense]
MKIPISIEQKKAIASILADIIYEEMLKDVKAKKKIIQEDIKYKH